MNVKEEFPPNYEKIKGRFDLTGKAPLFCYGDTVYNPYKAQLRQDLLVHEAVHVKQQGATKEEWDKWWDKYLDDNEFRLSQELEAYVEQYKFIKSVTKTETSDKFLDVFAEILSSAMYGNMITTSQAKTKLRKLYKSSIAN